MCERVFLIQCMKRSVFCPNEEVYIETYYWGPNYQNYVDTIEAAGKYPAEALAGAAGTRGDWIAHPHWIECEERASGGWC